MKLYKNLEPTDENIKETYAKDLLGRREDVDKFAAFLKGENCPVSVAVDGEWGSGKTFFVKQVAYRLDEDKVQIDPEKCLTVYYDAWENDNDFDPILSIVDCIKRAATAAAAVKDRDTTKLKKIVADIFCAAKYFSSDQTVQKIAAFLDEMSARNTDTTINNCQAVPTNTQIKEKLQELYNEIIPENGVRLVIFIDELDRCRPDFAVRVLERIKHFISVDEDNRVRMVFSINKKQLEHTIKKHYGEGYDSRNYLNRFFDLVIAIPEAGILPYVTQYTVDLPFGLETRVVSAAIHYFGIQIREINAFVAELISIQRTAKIEGMLSLPTPRVFMENIFPILLAAKLTDNDKYEKLVSGNGSGLIEDIWVNELGCEHNDHIYGTMVYLSIFQNEGVHPTDEILEERERILRYLNKSFLYES